VKTEIFKELRYLLILSAMIIIGGCGEAARDTNMLKQQGAAAFKSKNFTQAINLCREGLKAKPSDRDFLYYLGVSYAKLDLYDSAMIYIRRAKVLYPHDRDINRQLVQLCPKFQDFDCALRAIAVLIMTGDNEKMYWPQLAEYNYRNDELLLAVKYYKLALADNPDIPNYYLYLSVVLGQLGKLEEAINYLNRSIDRFGPSEESYANMGTMYINLRRFDKAEECFRSSLALNPDNISIWINLANILTTFDNREKKLEGLEIYKKYRAQTPEMYNLDSLIPALEKELGQ
jgi:tetratricopeptide (TPR) repeat protein